MRVLDYMKIKKLSLVCFVCLFIIINSYLVSLFAFQNNISDLIYLDGLLLVIIVSYLIVDFIQLKKRYEPIIQSIKNQQPLLVEDIQGTSYEESLIKELLQLHGQVEVIEQKKLQQALSDMEEYLTQWVHEIKLPLATLQMITERLDDYELATNLKNEVVKMNILVNNVIYGSRTTSSSEDLMIKEVSLEKIVRSSIKNNAYFLIKNRIDIHLEELNHFVFTDEKWMIYVMDQLILNAIKYRQNDSIISIQAKQDKNVTYLVVKDNGIGIRPEELSRIFNKGFTGSNGRGNTYKSTGMGLYFVKRILDKLGYEISVESISGEYTQFTIVFYHLSDYINLTKLSH